MTEIIRGVSVEMARHNGHVIVSTIHNNQYVHRQYIGFTKREAVAEFKRELRELDNQIIREVRS